MRVYDLPLWAQDAEKFPEAGIQGLGWRIKAREISLPSGEEAFEAHFSSVRERYPRYAITYISSRKGTWIAPQIFVEAKTRLAAQHVCDLISAACIILDGINAYDYDEQLALPHDITKPEDLTEYDLLSAGRHTVCRDCILPAAKFAAKMSRRKHIRYAALKLKRSFSLAAAHMMELDPFYNDKKFGVELDPRLHVDMATAITLAYSSIEELQLEPRSLASKPVKRKDGSWDPSALADLNRRLTKVNIDSNTVTTWSRRGTPTRIHKSPRAPLGKRQSWTRGIVRDQAVSIQDALVAASWIRSRCATHRYVKETESITLYDVHNVQFLARLLLMKSQGIWPCCQS